MYLGVISLFFQGEGGDTEGFQGDSRVVFVICIPNYLTSIYMRQFIIIIPKNNIFLMN